MTEERIKELIETYPITEQELITLIRTVAAEARNEGIDELCAGVEAEIAEIISDWYEWETAIEAIQKLAERLKGKG